ncbi:MAG: translation initiation factor IF-2, partial [Rhodothermales bacterium]|nr:translation initiation factor IF-2 [Rhodothermales bacterium]
SARRYKLEGTKVIGKIDLADVDSAAERKKKKRKRKRKADTPDAEPQAPAVVERTVKEKEKDKEKETAAAKNKKKRKRGPQVDAAEVEQSYQETLRTLEQGASRTRQKRRRQKRDDVAAQRQRDIVTAEEDSLILRVTEFISTGELAGLMDVSVTEVISTLFASGLMVSINQRLDADTISFVADEFGFEAEFITDFGTNDIDLGEDAAEDLLPRAPVVTVMGHVDHGKTSLLDYIRKANVVSGEAGGITQHIGAYHVDVGDGRKVTFLDTPGHEAFTAMRARGAQVTDVVILVVAADDSVMPQTIEAINHAKAAEVPIVVAINKIDRPDANPPRVMQGLADQGVLVEQYGGKAQCAFVSAKTGAGVQELLEKVLLEADLQELRANPTRNAYGVVIESRLEKGRGTVATILVQNGTMRVGDAFVAGIYSGRIRAMFNEWDKRVESIGPALPALVVGFTGAPEVGDQFVVLDEEREAREIAQRRQQIHREQSLRQRKHITLDEIGRRLALGDFQELNLIVKADVGGSVEALSDSLLKLSSEEVAVNIIHRGVGAITESDVMLASASDAVIIGFQVRPDTGARNLAEREEIDIRMYSIIYDAIKDVHDALEGLLSPEESEKITGVAEVREIFKVPKMGTIAGCFISEGRIRRSDRIRLIRDGIVIYDGEISSLRRFKDDVKEVLTGYECGIGMEHYNDIKVGDSFEAYEIVETKRKLSV